MSGGARAGRAVDAVWRIESARLIAGLARMTGDVGLAEDLAEASGLGDDLLALIFTCCHPLLSTEARVALTLRLLGGLGTEEAGAPPA